MSIRRFLLVVVLFLTACTNAHEQTESQDRLLAQNNTNTLNNLVGGSIDDLIQSVGVPTSTFETSDSEFYIYNFSQNITMSGSSPTYHSSIINNQIYTNSYGGIPPLSLELNCRLEVKTSNHIVVTWRAQGSACSVYTDQAKTWQDNRSIAPSNDLERAAYCYKYLDEVLKTNEGKNNPYINVDKMKPRFNNEVHLNGCDYELKKAS